MYGYGPTIVDVQRRAARADGDVVDMVSGRPDWHPPDGLREGLEAAAEANPERFQYSPATGLPELQSALADHHPGDADAGEVVVTAGTVEANHLTMARAMERSAGEVALVPDPAYPYYAARVRMLGGRVRRVPVEADGQLSPERLREHADEDVALVAVNSPNNPTGVVYPERTVREAVEIAEDVDAVLLADEVYARLDRSGRFASALAVDSPNRVVTGSVSKSMAATGLRVGYAVVPDPLRDEFTMRHVLTTIAASRPAQRAALTALETADEDHYRRARRRLGERADRVVEALSEAGADALAPDGGMYVFARLPGIEGNLSGVRRLIDEAGVAAMPGETFGTAFEDWTRFALTTDRVETAVERLSKLL